MSLAIHLWIFHRTWGRSSGSCLILFVCDVNFLVLSFHFTFPPQLLSRFSDISPLPFSLFSSFFFLFCSSLLTTYSGLPSIHGVGFTSFISTTTAVAAMNLPPPSPQRSVPKVRTNRRWIRPLNIPLSVKTGSKNLAIELDPDQVFFPGGTITGRVYRIQAPVSIEASMPINLSLRGHIATKTGTSFRCFPGSDAIELANSTSNSIYVHWPVHTPRGDNKVLLDWRFIFHIPHHVDHVNLPLGDRESFIDWKAPSVPLPPSFKIDATGEWPEYEANIDYYLHAYFIDDHKETTTATQPIRIQHFHQGPRASDRTLEMEYIEGTVSSHYLLPEYRDANRVWSARLKDMSPSSPETPMLVFRLEVHIPKAIHIDRTEPIRILLRGIILRNLSHRKLRNTSQILKLTDMSMWLSANTHIEKFRYYNRSRFNWKLPHIKVSNLNEVSLVLDDGQCRPYFEVARWMEFRMPQDVKPWGAGDATLTHDFLTYTIKHRHRIEYELKGEIEGKSVTMMGSHAIIILRPGGDLEA